MSTPLPSKIKHSKNRGKTDFFVLVETSCSHVASWCRLGPSWGHLGTIRGHLGAVPGCEKHRKKLWKIRFFAHVGASCSSVACCTNFYKTTVNADGKCTFMSCLGAFLGPSWGSLGALLGPSWEASWAIWRHFLVSRTSWYLVFSGISQVLVSRTS